MTACLCNFPYFALQSSQQSTEMDMDRSTTSLFVLEVGKALINRATLHVSEKTELIKLAARYVNIFLISL